MSRSRCVTADGHLGPKYSFMRRFSSLKPRTSIIGVESASFLAGRVNSDVEMSIPLFACIRETTPMSSRTADTVTFGTYRLHWISTNSALPLFCTFCDNVDTTIDCSLGDLNVVTHLVKESCDKEFELRGSEIQKHVARIVLVKIAVTNDCLSVCKAIHSSIWQKPGMSPSICVKDVKRLAGIIWLKV